MGIKDAIGRDAYGTSNHGQRQIYLFDAAALIVASIIPPGYSSPNFRFVSFAAAFLTESLSLPLYDSNQPQAVSRRSWTRVGFKRIADYRFGRCRSPKTLK